MLGEYKRLPVWVRRARAGELGGGEGHTQDRVRTVVGRASMRSADWASHSWLVSMYGMAVLFLAYSGVQGQ